MFFFFFKDVRGAFFLQFVNDLVFFTEIQRTVAGAAGTSRVELLAFGQPSAQLGRGHVQVQRGGGGGASGTGGVGRRITTGGSSRGSGYGSCRIRRLCWVVFFVLKNDTKPTEFSTNALTVQGR